MHDLYEIADLIGQTYPEEWLEPEIVKQYGDKFELTKRVIGFYSEAVDKLASIKVPDETSLIVLDWAGIGDAFYSRYIIHHIPEKAVWITNPKVANLYRDDTLLPVVPGFASPFRDARQRWVRRLSQGLSSAAAKAFNKPLLDVSYRVSQYYPTWGRRPTTYRDLFFDACKIKFNPKVQPTLTHKGIFKLQCPYVVVEHCSITFGPVKVEPYEELAQRLRKHGILTLYVGAKSDPPIKGAVDKRGFNLYDTFSMLKGCKAFIGRSSGNESLMGFLPNIPVFEVDVPDTPSFARGCHPNYVQLGLKNMPEDVERILCK